MLISTACHHVTGSKALILFHCPMLQTVLHDKTSVAHHCCGMSVILCLC